MPDRKRILMVGSGGIGLKHLRAFGSLTNAPRMAVVEPRAEAQARAVELGAEIVGTDWNSMRLSDFDGVLICAPAPMHIPMLKRCLTEGVPVLSEKPLSHAWDGVDELIELAGKSGAPPSGVAYTRRYVPAHEEASEMARSGKFGKLLTTRFSAGQPFYALRPDYRQIYYTRREMGGGCTLDFASHFIDLMQSYMGPVKSARGFQDHLALEGVQVEDTVAASLLFESGALGTLHVNQYQPVNENIFDFCGMDACLRVLEPELSGHVYSKGSDGWQPLNLSSGDYLEGLKRQAAAFVSVIGGGAPMHTSIADAARTLRVCLDLFEN